MTDALLTEFERHPRPWPSRASQAPETVPLTRAVTTSWAMNEVLTPKYMVSVVSYADATALAALRDEAQQGGRRVPSYTAMVMKAAALTLKKNPQANRAVLGLPFFKRLIQFNTLDIGVAVEKGLPSLPGAAYAAPIRDTANKPLDDITDELQALARCDESTDANYRHFRRILNSVPHPLSVWLINLPYWFPSLWARYRGCACWVNAPSKAGADLVIATWPWPITFSFGIVEKRPVVVGDEVKARLTMPIHMSFDRRIMGGGPASRVFADFKAVIETGLVHS